MRLQEYIDNFNRLDKPKNFPYSLMAGFRYYFDENSGTPKEYEIELLICLINESTGAPDYDKLLFSLKESIETYTVGYKNKLEQSIIKTFEKIKFQDTLRNLF